MATRVPDSDLKIVAAPPSFLKSNWPLFVILGVSAFFFLLRLNRDLLWDWDECVYAEYAKEMKQTGATLMNVWNGSVDLQKPPLYAWLLQIPLLFGNSEFHFRFLSVCASLGLIAAVYSYSNRYFSQKHAVLAASLLLATGSMIFYTGKVNTDIFLSFFVFLAFYFWTASAEKPSLGYISGMMLGLGVLMKGPAPAIFLLALIASVIISGKRETFLRLFKVVAGLAVVTIPWHLLALQHYGEQFFSNYIVESIIKRSAYQVDVHRSSWAFYFTQFYREFFPWIFLGFAIPAFVILGEGPSFRFRLKEVLKNEGLWLDIFLLMVIPFLCITLMKTGLPWYAFPIYPFFAIYLAANAICLLEKLQLRKGYYLLLIPVVLSALQFLTKGNAISNAHREIPPRYEVILKSSGLPEKELQYLVDVDFRTLRSTPSPEQQIPQTWAYGGNPCAVFYSNKRVNYFYSPDQFIARVQKGSGLFLIENRDSAIMKSLPVRVVFQNNQYTLFERS